MVQMDSRIRVTESKLVGMKNGVEIYYIEGFYSQDESDPITLPVEGISTGSILKEVKTGNIKQFSERSNTWVEGGGGGGGGGGSSSLSGLTDVDISNPTDGQTLVYNATSGKWENGAGGLEFVEIHFDPETDITDMTWQQAYDAIASGKLIIFKYAINMPEDNAVYAFTTIYTAVEKIFGGDGEPDEYHLSGTVVDYHGIPGASVLTASSPNDYLLI